MEKIPVLSQDYYNKYQQYFWGAQTTSYFHKLLFYIFACSLISRLQRFVYYSKKKYLRTDSCLGRLLWHPRKKCTSCLELFAILIYQQNEALAHYLWGFFSTRNIGNSCREFTFLKSLYKPILQATVSVFWGERVITERKSLGDARILRSLFLSLSLCLLQKSLEWKLH